MPNHTDILLERLRQFDEVTLLELLDITGEDIIERFKDKIMERRRQLFGEVEIMNTDDEELDENWDQDFEDGFEKLDLYDEEDFEDFPLGPEDDDN